MKSVVAIALLAVSTYVVGQQATVTINATCSPSCGPTTVQANGLAASGSGAGGVSTTSGAAPSVAGVGIPANTITIFAPSTVQTPYGIALYPTTASLTPPNSGFWYGTVGSGATFPAPTVSGTVIQGPTITPTLPGSGYATAPPCYFSGANTIPGTCHFTLSGTGIASVVVDSGGSGYTSGSVTVVAAPTSYLNYVPPSDLTNPSTAYNVQTSSGTPTSGHLASFNSTDDVV